MKNLSELSHLQYERNIAYNNNDMETAKANQEKINNFKAQY